MEPNIQNLELALAMAKRWEGAINRLHLAAEAVEAFGYKVTINIEEIQEENN